MYSNQISIKFFFQNKTSQLLNTYLTINVLKMSNRVNEVLMASITTG